MTMKPRAIVFGSKGVNATGLIRSLGQGGCEVTFASTYSRIESKYTSGYLHLPENPKKQVACLAEYIQALPEKPALYTVDDEANFALDDNHELFKEIAYCPNAAGKLRQVSDKTIMAEKARECGLNVAPFVKIDISDNTAEENPLGFPVIIKPYAGYAGAKGDIRICRNQEEYAESVQRLRQKDYTQIMLQTFLESANQFEIGLMGFALPDGRVMIPCSIKKIRSYPPGRGSTSFAQIKKDLCGADIEKLTEFVRSTGYVGIFDIEMIVSDGVPYFIEINYRNGQYGYAPTAAGYNLPKNWFAGMRGEKIEEIGNIEEIFYMNERDDFLHVRKEKLPLRQWLREFHSAKACGMFCHGDQRPYIRQYLKVPDRVKIGVNKFTTRLHDYFVREEWAIAIRPVGDKYLFEEGGTETAFKVIPNSFRCWCADPFIISVGEKDYLFFEMFDRFKGRGVIGYREISPDGKIGEMKLAYETQKHLSFPFVFEKDKEIYMMPESSYDRNVTLLKAVHFPDKWEKVHTWFDGEKFCDSVMFKNGNDVYMLTQPVEVPYTHAKLNLYKMENGNWVPDKANPIVNNAAHARMAGAIVELNGQKIRPSQNCSDDSYGLGVNFGTVEMVDGGYAEQLKRKVEISEIKTDDGKHYFGIHTYNHSKRFEVIDLKLRERVRLGYLF